MKIGIGKSLKGFLRTAKKGLMAYSGRPVRGKRRKKRRRSL